MDEIYRFQKITERFKLMVLWGGVKGLQILLWLKNRNAARIMNSLDIENISISSKQNWEPIIQGKYYVGKTMQYCCTEDKVELVTLDLPTFTLEKKILSRGERVLIPPFVVHTFRVDRADNQSIFVKRLSSKAFSYTFDIEPGSDVLIVPNNLQFNKSKVRFGEVVLRTCALKEIINGLTYDNYRMLLHFVYHIAVKIKLSKFEHALLLGMAFDWIQRLSLDKARRARITFGKPIRVFNGNRIGYHDISPTTLGFTTDLFLTYEHRTHLPEVVPEDELPGINIERNVLIGDGASLEVGKGLCIKEFSWIGPGVSLLKHIHKYEGGGQFARCTENTKLTYLEIGPYALIGQLSRILPKALYIGKGAVVGTSSVVTRSVGDYAVVAGNPARCVGYNEELSQRIEEQWRKSESPYCEHTIPYLQITQRVKKPRNTVIVGARSPQTVVGAGYHFKNVLVVNSCRGSVPLLLKVLREKGLYNVCLQQNPFCIKEEINYWRPSVVILLDDSRNCVLEQEVLDAVKENESLLVVPRNGNLSSLISTYGFIKNNNPIDDEHYKILQVDMKKT